jgi:hypothetical protein
LEAAAQSAGLPLLRFAAKSGYSQAQIREAFTEAIDESRLSDFSDKEAGIPEIDFRRTRE